MDNGHTATTEKSGFIDSESNQPTNISNKHIPQTIFAEHILFVLLSQCISTAVLHMRFKQLKCSQCTVEFVEKAIAELIYRVEWNLGDYAFQLIWCIQAYLE